MFGKYFGNKKLGPVRKFNSILFLVFNSNINVNTFRQKSSLINYIPDGSFNQQMLLMLGENCEINRHSDNRERFIFNVNKLYELSIDKFFKNSRLS